MAPVTKKPSPARPVLRAFAGGDPTGLDAFETDGQIVVEVNGVKALFLQVDTAGVIRVSTYGPMAILPQITNSLLLELRK